jgi:hypothetical protein
VRLIPITLHTSLPLPQSIGQDNCDQILKGFSWSVPDYLMSFRFRTIFVPSIFYNHARPVSGTWHHSPLPVSYLCSRLASPSVHFTFLLALVWFSAEFCSPFPPHLGLPLTATVPPLSTLMLFLFTLLSLLYLRLLPHGLDRRHLRRVPTSRLSDFSFCRLLNHTSLQNSACKRLAILAEQHYQLSQLHVVLLSSLFLSNLTCCSQLAHCSHLFLVVRRCKF